MLVVWEAVRWTCWRFLALTGSTTELRLPLPQVKIDEEEEEGVVLDLVMDMVEEVVVVGGVCLVC